MKMESVSGKKKEERRIQMDSFFFPLFSLAILFYQIRRLLFLQPGAHHAHVCAIR